MVPEGQGEGATLIPIDPRFTRTSALCALHIGIRAGSDIAFLGGVINYILTQDRWFKEYVTAYTNAATMIQEGFQDTEDLEGVFSGHDPATDTYDAMKGRWGYEDSPSDQGPEDHPAGEGRPGAESEVPLKGQKGVHGYAIMGGPTPHDSPRSRMTRRPEAAPARDPSLQHPRCVLQILRRHFARYTPEVVAEICGCSPGKWCGSPSCSARSSRPRPGGM
jgi:formate dehydrogenase major subunit